MRSSRALTLVSSVVLTASMWAGQAAPHAANARAANTSPAGTGAASTAPIRTRSPAALTGPAVPVTLSFLDGVYCTSRRDCWAVGLRLAPTAAIVNQILHWTGTTWRAVRAPDPAGTSNGATNTLAAVRCATARECWAVGYYSKGGRTLNSMLHWNGRAWFATRTPQPDGTGAGAHNQLTDVTCSSTRDCWATGYFGRPGSSTLNQILHWNGKSWSRLRVPEPAGTSKTSTNLLYSVRCPSSRRCLAVGTSWRSSQTMSFNQAQTWAGRSWARQQVPSPGGGTASHVDQLSSLGCGSRTSCFAVGHVSLAGNKLLSQALHWNGRSWSRSFTPQPAGTGAGDQNELGWVTCTSDRDCWAVGYSGHVGPPTVLRNQADHWNGRRWVDVHVPNPASKVNDIDVLMSVRCTDAANCWAVGGQNHTGNVSDEILHWNGKKWFVWLIA